MEMRAHRDDGIEQSGEELAYDALAHDLACDEFHVLSHIGQVWSDKGEVVPPSGACITRCEEQLHQFLVGVVQTAQHGNARRYGRGQTQFEFAIRESVAAHHHRIQAGGSTDGPGVDLIFFEVQKHGSEVIVLSEFDERVGDVACRPDGIAREPGAGLAREFQIGSKGSMHPV